jgi:S-DNA-T family DNA segregation ATPase FtsK/SpoIIIE
MASREEMAGRLAAIGAQLGYRRARPPWLPPLPERLTLTELRMGGDRAIGQTRPAGSDFAIGLADLPEEQRQIPLVLDPSDGNVLVVGAPRSGRTQAARTIAVTALEQGWAVHVVAARTEAFADLTGHGRFGTLVGFDDPRRLARLLRLLRHGEGNAPAPAGPVALVVDGAESLASAVLPGFDDHPLESLSQGGSGVNWIAATSLARHAGGRWAGHFPVRLVLATIDQVEDVAAGLTSALAGRHRPPGRAVAVQGGTQTISHLAIADTGAVLTPPEHDLAPPVRLMPLPGRPGPLPPARPGWAWLGYGGDDAGPVGIDLADGQPVGVIGPPGSGRTTILRSIAAQCDAVGARPLFVDAADHPSPWPSIEAALDGGATVIADNLDQAPHTPPALPRTGTLVAGVTTAAAGSFQGPGPLLRSRAPLGIVLRPAMPGSAEVLATRLNEAVDPRRARTPGFGVVVSRGRVIPVQIPFFGDQASPLPVDAAGPGAGGL